MSAFYFRQKVGEKMATIRTAIQIHDGMSPAFKSMNKVMGIVLDSFEAIQSASSEAVDTSNIEMARRELLKVESTFNDVERQIREADSAQQQFNDDLRNGQHAADGLSRSIKTVVGAVLSIAAIKKGANTISDWLGFADVQIASEKQLAQVMANMGATRDEFDSIKKTASNIQGYTTYGDEALIAGAGELATYLQSGDAIEAMMGTLANYSAGMGGMEVDKAGMVEYATQLGKALDGQFDGLRKKGFDVTDAQKKILELGTEMERVAVITEIIDQSWSGLAESLANTPQGQLIQMSNAWGDIKETLGMYVYPTVLLLFQAINANMPQAEALMIGFASAAIIVMEALIRIVNIAGSVASVIIDNWSLISPVVFWLATSLGILVSIMILKKGATLLATGAMWALNAAMTASPITWIVFSVIALIAVIYLGVAAFNKFADTSVSATGIVAGAIMVALAFIGNLFVGFYNLTIDIIAALWNHFAGFAEFFANVFNDPIGSIVRLFSNMADSILGILQGVAKAMDAIFGSNLADSVKGWRSSLETMVTDLVGEAEIKIPRMDTSKLYLDRFDYGAAYNTGYEFGSGLEDKVSGAFKMDGLMDTSAFGVGDILDGIGGSGLETAANTAKMADSLDVSQEDLRYLRDLAEQETVNRFTTAEIKVEMSNINHINSEMDLDGVVTYLEEMVEETMNVAAEGVHD